MKSNKHIIASIFLILFSCMQIADLHSIGHDDATDTDCNICQIASEGMDDNFCSSDSIDLPRPIFIPLDILKNEYQNQFVDSFSKFSFLNKAPPVA